MGLEMRQMSIETQTCKTLSGQATSLSAIVLMGQVFYTMVQYHWKMTQQQHVNIKQSTQLNIILYTALFLYYIRTV